MPSFIDDLDDLTRQAVAVIWRTLPHTESAKIKIFLDDNSSDPVWKWVITHNDFTVLVTPGKYQHMTDYCHDTFGQQLNEWTTTGKMGWKFKHYRDAMVFYMAWV